jgi:phage major head subunit gpT-like protein
MENMAINIDNTANIGRRDIIGAFFIHLEQYLGQNWTGKIVSSFKSDQGQEIYRWLGVVPSMREWVGGRQAKTLSEFGITIPNKTYEATMDIPVDWLRRDKTGQIMTRVKELAMRAAEFDADAISSLLLAGADEAALCYDKTPFFSTSHEEGKSGKQSNILTAKDTSALRIKNPLNPTSVDFNAAVLAALTKLYQVKDGEGRPFNKAGKEFLVMAPTIFLGAATGAVYGRILNSPTGSFDNPVLASGEHSGFRVDAIVNPLLNDQLPDFYVFRTDTPSKPFIIQDEVPLKMGYIGPGSEREFVNNEYLYGVTRVCGAGYGYWQYALKCSFSA